MENFDFIFVVLTYRNSEDLIKFFISIVDNVKNYKAIVVNSYFDKKSSDQIYKIAMQNEAFFIEVENKGYGYGNNQGIKYAIENFNFQYLIVSNPDIEIQKLSLEHLVGAENAVIGPRIVTINGRRQNPLFYKKSMKALKLIYQGLKNNNKIKFFIGRLINLSLRTYGIHFGNNDKGTCLLQVYQLHGCFVIFSHQVLKLLGDIYDEKMFLFAEEAYLAYKLENKKIKSFYCDNIKVLHKEDGSMKFRNDVNEQLKNANIYVYEKYYHFK